MKKQCVTFKYAHITEQNLANFAFLVVGILSGLFVFRKVFFVFSLIYNCAVFYLAFRVVFFKFNSHSKKTSWTFQIKFFSLIFSLLFSFVFGTEFFAKNFVALASQFLMIFIFLKKPVDDEACYYILGLKISFMINYLFAIVQLVFILSIGINIFYPIGLYLGLYESVSAQQMASTRVTGLIWDPYVLGMYCALGFFLFKSYIIKLMAVVILYFSFSRSGEVAFLCGIAYYLFPHIKRMIKKDCLAMPVFLMLATVFIIMIPFFIDALDFDRGFNKKSSGWRRIEYITKVPEIWSADKNPFLAFFGGAPAYTGARHVLTPVDSMAKRDSCRSPKDKQIYWTVETDWFGILIGREIFGLFCYFSLYLYIIFSNRNRTNQALAVAILMAGVGYYYDTAIFAMFVIYFAGATKDINKYLKFSRSKRKTGNFFYLRPKRSGFQKI